MFIKNLTISGFRSFSNDAPQTIDFDNDKTVLIGNNGTGKSAALDALNKLFCVDATMRLLKPSDFYSEPDEEKTKEKELYIDIVFGFEKIKSDIAIPNLIEQLTVDVSGEVVFRVRLEATVNYEFSDLGDVDEKIYIITDCSEVPSDESKIKLSPLIRNSIQIHYVPASRDPLKQLAYSSTAVLGRLLKAAKWDESTRVSYKEKSRELVKIIKSNTALDLISNSINTGWGALYKEKIISNAELNFPFNSIDDLMRLIKLFLSPSEQGTSISSEILSDGQRSLLYLAIIHALFCIENKIKDSNFSDECGFDNKKLRLPIFSLISLEEPENHLSPHYLGRIINSFSNYTNKESFQMVISTHSTAIMSRIEPSQVRHFSLKSNYSHVNSLSLPKKKDEQFKFINEAVKAYPEIYFSKLVILVEGDSEQVILPRIFESYNYNLDSKNITIAPLGGKHVNHFWRLLESIKTQYITLLDLDLGRNGGGFERIKYAINQLSNYKNVEYVNKSIIDNIPAWDSPENPLYFTLKLDGKEINIINKLKEHNIYFSSPLDMDYLMISHYPEVYCTADKTNNENGPQALKKIDEFKSEIIKCVLKEGHKGDSHYTNDPEYLKKFIWYNFRFLGNKSKPASHIRLMNKLTDDLEGNLPEVLKEISIKAGAIYDE
ncbi:hypothetical protein BJK05_18845 [Pectobacterium polaris]|uniref:ATP-dependent nuclease n=1 Tax=Pectobacterium polaris TaxID=2042057 RepID=UPI000BACCC93|nr:TOPRIM nucleotidyl transferase/hydrolase domain-containing protein [Pectobacterium polaris]ASY81925.1 hypothetical protein BJK05_18845 [Pectobacterium polaris]